MLAKTSASHHNPPERAMVAVESDKVQQLNSHLTVPTFKMETAEVIRISICKGEWVV